MYACERECVRVYVCECVRVCLWGFYKLIDYNANTWRITDTVGVNNSDYLKIWKYFWLGVRFAGVECNNSQSVEFESVLELFGTQNVSDIWVVI